MLRTFKYGLAGAVVAGVIGGTVGWTSVHGLSVKLVVDGRRTTVETTASTVGQLLAQSGYTAGRHDLVAPAPATPLANGTTVVYKHGRLLHLEVDGRQRDVWTTARTVSAALADLGFDAQSAVSVSRSRRLPLSPTDISVRTPKDVTVAHDGRVQRVTTTAATVGRLLSDLSVRLHRFDRLNVETDAPLTEGEHVRVTRVVHGTRVTTRRVAFATRSHPDPDLQRGRTKVVRAGRAGLARTTWAVVYVDGRLARRVKVRTRIVRRPVSRVISRGTGLGPNATPAQTQALARSLLGDYGFGSGEMGCLIDLWNAESGWRATAMNPNGGAYGIPQSLPGDKMAAAGPDWRTNPETQIRWGLNYIRSRYGTPCGAWSTWNAHGGWY